MCGYDSEKWLTCFETHEYSGTYISLSGQKCSVIDISDSHDECILLSETDAFASQIVDEHIQVCTQTFSKELKYRLDPLPAHFLIKCPYLCLGLLSNSIMIECSYDQAVIGTNINWKEHGEFLVKYIVTMLPAKEMYEKLEILRDYFDIDHKICDINFVLDARHCDGKSNLSEKINCLLDLGLTFDAEKIPTKFCEILRLDDKILDRLVAEGLDFQKIITNNTHILSRLSNNDLGKLIKYQVDANFVAKILLIQSGLMPQLKYLSENHGLDILSVVDL
jgi:hypothetical protein